MPSLWMLRWRDLRWALLALLILVALPLAGAPVALRDFIMFLIMTLVLVFKPSGLFGRPHR